MIRIPIEILIIVPKSLTSIYIYIYICIHVLIYTKTMCTKYTSYIFQAHFMETGVHELHVYICILFQFPDTD